MRLQLQGLSQTFENEYQHLVDKGPNEKKYLFVEKKLL